jgi:hypothetical protein
MNTQLRTVQNIVATRCTDPSVLNRQPQIETLNSGLYQTLISKILPFRWENILNSKWHLVGFNQTFNCENLSLICKHKLMFNKQPLNPLTPKDL